MARFKNFCYGTLLVCSILFFSLALLSGVTTPFIYGQPNWFKKSFMLLLALLTMVLFHGFITWLLSVTKKWDQKKFGLFLLVLAFLPRIVYALSIDTIPVSDFLLNHESALDLLKGNAGGLPFFYQIFTFRIGYPLWISYLYQLFGAHLWVVQSFNILISLFTLFFLYQIAGACFGPMPARTAGLLFAFWPSQILYCNVLASEHLFVALLLASIFSGMQCYQSQSQSQSQTTGNGRKGLYCFITAVLLTLSRIIRPLTVFVFLAWGCVLIYHSIGNKKTASRWAIFLVVAALYSFLFSAAAKGIENKTGIDIKQSYSGFSLAVGLNYEERGVYNQKDTALVNNPNRPPEQMDREAKAVAWQRAKDNGLNLLSLFKTKFIILWGSDTHGYNYGLRESEGKNILGNFLIDHQNYIQKAAHLFYLYLLFFGLISFGYKKPESAYTLFILVFFLLHVAAYCLLEAQSRYVYPAVLLNIVFSGNGLYCFDPFAILQQIRLPAFRRRLAKQ